MNQVSIGKFILELRKEKNMTQQELADKLGITDRAISKWENGRGLPDLSLLIPLCEILDVKVNELLSGEKLSESNYQEKSEENIIKTINYTDKRIKNTKKVSRIILFTILIFIITFITIFSIDISRMKKGKPVLFSTWGFYYIPPIDIEDEEIRIAIEEYLVNRGDNELKHHENEKAFVSLKPYLLEEKKNNIYNVYAWVLEEKYYLENNEIKQDSGSSIPHKIVVQKKNNNYIIKELIIPRDGSLYKNDMKRIFPSKIRKDINNAPIDGTIEKLKININQQIKLYFHK